MAQESAFQAGMIPVSGCGEKQDAGIASVLLTDSAGGRFHMYTKIYANQWFAR